MKLRKLKEKDAPLMLEWMHDESIVRDLNSNFISKTIDDCLLFIEKSIYDKNNVNLAIVADNDEYIGTVSLKHIDCKEKSAEFAIVVRKSALGLGYSWYGMCEILKIAFEQKNLQTVYWCVSQSNSRACRFYEKHNFNVVNNISPNILKRFNNADNLKWYSVKREEYYVHYKNMLLNCIILNIKTVITDKSGKLSYFESNRDIPFEIKRIYYISNVPGGIRRGYHAHKHLKQFLFCPYGKINLILDDGYERKEIILDNPSIGVIIIRPIWREIEWIEKDSVLCVAASDYYDTDDYIRDYNSFLAYLKIYGGEK